MVCIDNFELNKDSIAILKEFRVYLLTERHNSDNSITSYILDIYKYGNNN